MILDNGVKKIKGYIRFSGFAFRPRFNTASFPDKQDGCAPFQPFLQGVDAGHTGRASGKNSGAAPGPSDLPLFFRRTRGAALLALRKKRRLLFFEFRAHSRSRRAVRTGDASAQVRRGQEDTGKRHAIQRTQTLAAFGALNFRRSRRRRCRQSPCLVVSGSALRCVSAFFGGRRRPGRGNSSLAGFGQSCRSLRRMAAMARSYAGPAPYPGAFG